MRRSILFTLILIVVFTFISTSTVGAAPVTSKIPTFSILSVVKNTTVTIQTYNFPAHEKFDVLMNYMGTKGKYGLLVDVVQSGGGGSFKATFPIPPEFKGEYQIAIRLESQSSPYFAYNWFYNNTAGSGGGGKPPHGSYAGYPTFSITAVVRNKTVSILTKNLPPHDKFEVLMGPMGTKGINGYHMDTINSGKGGSKSYTFSIPPQLKGSNKISIRLQSIISPYYAYNWFWNNTTD